MPTSLGQPNTGLVIPMSPAQTADTELGKALSETSIQVAKHPRGPTQAGALQCSTECNQRRPAEKTLQELCHP